MADGAKRAATGTVCLAPMKAKALIVALSVALTSPALAQSRPEPATRLVVRAPEDGRVELDGTFAGMGTWSGTTPAGNHSVRVTAPSKRPFQSEVTLAHGETRELVVAMEPDGSAVPAWAWVGITVVVVGGLALGGYFLLKDDDNETKGTMRPTLIPTAIRF